MIRSCNDTDFDNILAIVNDAAQAYCGVIPADCWHVPYMPKECPIRCIRSHGLPGTSIAPTFYSFCTGGISFNDRNHLFC